MKKTAKRKKSTAPELRIREIAETDGTYTWTTFMVQGWSEGGKRQRKKFKDEIEAKNWRDLKSIELTNNSRERNAVVTRLSDDEIIEAENAFKMLAPRYTLSAAVDYFLKNFCDPSEKRTIDEARKMFLDAKERKARENTRRNLKMVIQQFQDSVKNCHLHEVTGAQITKYLEGLRARGGVEKATRKTWNNYRNDLSGFFKWCVLQRWIDKNPVSGIPYFTGKEIEEDRDAPDTLTVDEARSLMAFVEGYKGGRLVRYFALALFAGIRPDGEMSKLPAKAINAHTGEITIEPKVSKTGTFRAVTIQPNLKRWLEDFPSEIFPVNHDRDIKLIRSKCGLSARPRDVLRHTFCTFYVARWGSVGEAAEQAGNSERIIKRHYKAHISVSKDEAKQFWNIGPTGTVEQGEAAGDPEGKIIKIA